MRPIRFLQLAFILCAAFLVYSFVATAQEGELRKSCLSLCLLSPNYVGSNRTAPNLVLRDLQGTQRRLSDLQGKTVVLEFWTTTCTACRQQLPALAELAESLQTDSRFAVLTVAVDESVEAVRQLLLETTGKAAPFPVLLDPESTYVLNRYGTRLFPETWIVDPQGVIRARFDGPRDWSSPWALDWLQGIARGDACALEVQNGFARGRAAPLCEQVHSER